MDIISAYREVGTFRGAAVVSGTTHKTVKRVIARHEAAGARPARVPRGHNYDAVAELVAGRVKATAGRISAKRLLPAAQAAGYGGYGSTGCLASVHPAWLVRQACARSMAAVAFCLLMKR
jgi:hypothetical protein